MERDQYFGEDDRILMSRAIEWAEVELPVHELPADVRADFLSDVHLRSAADLESLSTALASPRSSTLLLGGDYSEREEHIEPFFRLVAARYARIIGVMGNNDLPFFDAVTAAARRHGAVMLRDTVCELEGMTILGTLDPYREKPSFTLPEPPTLLLSHSPDVLRLISERDRVSILCGHTHAGQMRFPFWPWWWSHTAVGNRYGEGRSTRGENELFTGRGIGCSLLDIRNVPSEIYAMRFGAGL